MKKMPVMAAKFFIRRLGFLNKTMGVMKMVMSKTMLSAVWLSNRVENSFGLLKPKP